MDSLIKLLSKPQMLALAAIVTTLAAHTQNLPATPPTYLPAPIAATPVAGSTDRPHHAEVTYAAGLLDVRANDSSLNQILRSISRLTGMKITGGVADQRVFGNYGPAEPGTILATLLDGTGSNMLLRISTTPGEPSELVLTPRNGGATPPGPDSAIYAEAPEPPPAAGNPALLPQRIAPQPVAVQQVAPAAQNKGPASGPSPIPQPLNNVNGSPTNTDPTASTLPTTNSVPIDTVATPSTTPSTSGIVDAPNPPPPGSTTSPNPGNVATPEQVYQQLKALQAAQQKQQQSQPSTAAPQ